MKWKGKDYIVENKKKQIENINYLISNKKYHLARRVVLNLLEEYPNFVEAKSALVTINHYLDLDEENVLRLLHDIDVFDRDIIKSTLFETYYYMHQYDKAFEYLDDFMTYAPEKKIRDYRVYEIILMKKLGMGVSLLDVEQKDYVLTQVTNYQLDSFYKNYSISHNFFKTKGIIFNNNINLGELYNAIQNNFKQAQRSKILRPFDLYYFNCPNFAIDTQDNTVINYVRVKTIPGTSQILFIDPVREEYVDISNDLTTKKDDEYHSSYQYKRKTQSEKFYSRYGK